jgi:mannitol/fructose-specific phosphotransferase system IIA component (Ntr-type)
MSSSEAGQVRIHASSRDVNNHGRMHRLINQLNQLQDLLFARDQQEASMPGARLAQLDSAIKGMVQDLPVEIRTIFDKMYRKGNLSIVPIANGVCSACGMSIPVSQVHAVHAADDLHQCPNCARFLFYTESAPRRVGARRRRGEPPQLGIARFSAPTLMLPQLRSAGRDEALAEICHAMEGGGFVDSGDRLLEEALRREAIASTAVDHGLAFPHVRGVEGGGLTLALGLSRKGIKFSGSGKNLTRIVFFIVIPTAASSFYLKLLAGLTQTFREESARNILFDAETPEALWKALAKATRATVP